MKYVLIGIGVLVVVLLVVLPLPVNKIPSFHLVLEEKEPEATIVFGGDMMFDRYIRQVFETVGGDYLFSCVDPVLLESDAVVANLEGPITESASVSAGTKDGDPGHYTFTFPPQTAALLASHNVSIVSIGNNHIANFSLPGIRSTKTFLDAAGVLYFGDPEGAEEDRVLRKDIEGIPFSFVNWSDWTSDKTDHTVAQVRKEAEAGRVTVVYAHWGEEYLPVQDRVRQLAHSFVDAGAALVVGSHPHIVQEVERYNDISIYYSLGNFIFDQYFSDAVTNGLLLSVVFTNEGVQRIREIPIELRPDGRTCGREASSR